MALSSRPPPLQLLLAFEASARLLSFSKAGEELHVTAAAISQQIKQLEAHLGLSLFQRLTRRIELTEAGLQFAELTSKTLNTYRLGYAEFTHNFAQPTLRLTTTPQIADKYLIPKLSAFQKTLSDVRITLDTSMELDNFSEKPIDAAIRIGNGEWPGLESKFLCKCQAVILAAPTLLKHSPIQQINDLKHHTLIDRSDAHFGWSSLAKLYELPEIPSKNIYLLDTDLAALRAAEQGLGVVLGFAPVHSQVTQKEQHESLVAVLPPIEVSFNAYFVHRPNSGKETLLIRTFEWIKSSIQTGGI